LPLVASFAVAGEVRPNQPLPNHANANVVLRIGDQKVGNQALLSAAGELTATEYRVEWKESPAAQPLLEALNSGALDASHVRSAGIIRNRFQVASAFDPFFNSSIWSSKGQQLTCAGVGEIENNSNEQRKDRLEDKRSQGDSGKLA
jgi:ABC-type nitrate/sulfonate/bicarbonate transport system substrate-binding protein